MVVLVDATITALLALASYEVVLAGASTVALLALASSAVVLTGFRLTVYFFSTVHSFSIPLLLLVVVFLGRGTFSLPHVLFVPFAF